MHTCVQEYTPSSVSDHREVRMDRDTPPSRFSPPSCSYLTWSVGASTMLLREAATAALAAAVLEEGSMKLSGVAS